MILPIANDTIGASLIYSYQTNHTISVNNKCKPPLATPRGKLQLATHWAQSSRGTKIKLKNQSPENHENPFALSFKANFTLIHA